MKVSYLEPNQLQERAAAQAHSRYVNAFVATPLVAIGVWYGFTLIALAIVNGGLRFRTDIVAMAIGAVTVGLAVAVAATALALLLFDIVRRFGVVSLRSALTGGVIVGIALTTVAWALGAEWWSAAFTPVHGVGGGPLTAAVWWHMAGRPGERADPGSA
jgi:hypothetical protein